MTRADRSQFAALSQLASTASATAAELSRLAEKLATLRNGMITVLPQPRRRSGMDGFDEQAEEAFPLAVGHFGGLRIWSLRDGQLVGANGMTWKPGENVATCREGHRPPCDGTCTVDIRTDVSSFGLQRIPLGAQHCSCECGFWAYWDLNDRNLGEQTKDQPVIGVVEGYGRVLEGERGFRAEKARIVGLHVGFEMRAVRYRRERRDASMYSFNPHSRDDWIAGMNGAILVPRSEMDPHPDDVIAAIEANLKIQTDLEDRYECRVYDTTAMMLMKHPLGNGG